MARWQVAVLIGCVLCAGCSFLPPVAPLPEGLEARAGAIGDEVSQVRGLPMLAQVPAGIQQEQELRESMRKSIEKDWDARDDAMERVYKILGLLPEQLDIKRYLIDFYTGQVAGYYDPETKRFFLKADEASSEREEDFTIAHEFTHALQDQHFDLEKIHHALEGNEDQGLAADALIEGDAMLGGIDHYAFRLGAPASSANPLSRLLIRTVVHSATGGATPSTNQSPDLADTPPVIARQIIFPYLEGALFASTVRSEFGQQGLNAVFSDLPESTEQILYPERYIDRRDHPVQIHLAAPPEGWQPLVEQTLGMLSLQVLLREYLGAGAERYAEGWDGDRYVLWKTPGGEEVLGWVSVWDYEDQAARFASRYRELLSARRPGRDVAVLRSRDVVVAVQGSPDAAALAERLLASELVRVPGDQPPLRLGARLLRWPLWAEQLDRVFEVHALGGQLFELRTHSAGYRIDLLDGLIARAERSPDRADFSVLAGLIWKSSDAQQGYSAGSIPALMSYHARSQRDGPWSDVRVGSLPDVQSVLTFGWLPPLPPLFALRRSPLATELSLLGRPGLRVAWGPGTRKGGHLSLFFLRVPFL